jgi:hypothetical protein
MSIPGVEEVKKVVPGAKSAEPQISPEREAEDSPERFPIVADQAEGGEQSDQDEMMDEDDEDADDDDANDGVLGELLNDGAPKSEKLAASSEERQAAGESPPTVAEEMAEEAKAVAEPAAPPSPVVAPARKSRSQITKMKKADLVAYAASLGKDADGTVAQLRERVMEEHTDP